MGVTAGRTLTPTRLPRREGLQSGERGLLLAPLPSGEGLG